MSQLPLKQISSGGATVGQALVFNGTTWAPGTVSAVSTQQDDVYVDAAGSDSNPGTVGSPFLTIQHALDVLPKIRKHPAIVHVGAGNFAGAYVQGFQFETGVAATGSWLQVIGTYKNFVPATGSATGTVTSAAAGSNGSFATFTDSAQTWTTNDLRQQLVRFETGALAGQIFKLQSNTATQCSLLTATAPAVGVTYTILDWDTHITTGVVTPKLPTAAVGTSQYGFGFLDMSTGTQQSTTVTGTYVTVEALDIICARGAFSSSMCIPSLDKCRIVGTSTQNFSLLQAAAGIVLARSYVGYIANAFSFLGGTTYSPSNIASWSCLHRGVGSGSVVRAGAQYSVLTSNYDSIENLGYGFMRCSGRFASTHFDTISVCAIDTNPDNYTQIPDGFGQIIIGSAGGSHCHFSNCGIAVRLYGGIRASLQAGVDGGGNTVGVDVINGSVAQINAAWGVLGSTADLRMDGVTSTLTALRALSPKIWGHATGSQIRQDDTTVSWSSYMPNLGDTRAAPANKDMTASVTTADNQLACSTAMVNANYGGGYITVTVNGQAQKVGDGTKVGVDCYFSGDSGATARAFSAVVAGDLLYWNGSVAGWQLSATDTIDFSYVQ
jgi:hypothetical protein